jgi:hypothetical protein
MMFVSSMPDMPSSFYQNLTYQQVMIEYKMNQAMLMRVDEVLQSHNLTREPGMSILDGTWSPTYDPTTKDASFIEVESHTDGEDRLVDARMNTTTGTLPDTALDSIFGLTLNGSMVWGAERYFYYDDPQTNRTEMFRNYFNALKDTKMFTESECQDNSNDEEPDFECVINQHDGYSYLIIMSDGSEEDSIQWQVYGVEP